MVQGRISGSGAPFSAGEMTVTRAAVRLDGGQVGVGYVGGRQPRQAELVALIDALSHLPNWRQPIEDRIVAPQVDFFTVAREAGT